MMLTRTEMQTLPEWAAIEEWWDSGNENNERLYGIVFRLVGAVIAKNNAKVLADLKPEVYRQNLDGSDSWSYSSETVSALIQDRDSLAARVRELEAQAEMDSAQINSLIKKVPPRPDEQPRKARFA